MAARVAVAAIRAAAAASASGAAGGGIRGAASGPGSSLAASSGGGCRAFATFSMNKGHEVLTAARGGGNPRSFSTLLAKWKTWNNRNKGHPKELSNKTMPESALGLKEGSIGIHKHVPAAHHTTVAPNNSMIHGYAARCFSTLPCTRAASEPGSLASGMPSAITLKPPFVNSIGVKRTFSSSSSTNYTMSLKPKVPTSTAELEAKYASEREAMHAEVEAWNAKMNRENSVFSISLAFELFGGGYIFWCLGSMMNTGSSSSCCSACCKCQSTGQNPRQNEDKSCKIQ